MSDSVVFSIGDYTFSPAPLINITQTINRTGSGEVFSITYGARISGVLTNLRRPQCGANIACTMLLINELREALSDCDCTRMYINCNGSTLIDTNVKVLSVTFNESNNNWVFTVPYTIDVQWHTSEEAALAGVACAGCLTQVSETWDVQYLNAQFQYADCTSSGYTPEYLTVNHSVSANGINCCDTSGNATVGWQTARDWVLSRIGVSTADIDCSGVFSFNPTDFKFFDHVRVKNKDELNGGFSISESWVAVGNSGVKPCIEDFTIDISTENQSRLKTYSVNGTINGLEERDANHNLTVSKYENAQTCWSQIEPLLVERINCFVGPTCPIHIIPISKQIGRNPSQGVITYAYNYNDRPISLINNSASEAITINDTLKTEKLTTVDIIGRAAPLIIGCNQVIARQRNVSINVVMPHNTGCPPIGSRCDIYSAMLSNRPDTEVEAFLCCVESGLIAGFDNVFRDADTRSWDPILGVYTRNTSWTYSQCDESIPGSFCN